MTKALYQLNLRLNVTSETTASRSFYSDLSYSKAIAELRGAKYCISTKVVENGDFKKVASKRMFFFPWSIIGSIYY
jgi:hypothetical protein